MNVAYLTLAFSPTGFGDELLFFSTVTIFPITALAFSFSFSFSFSVSCVFAQSPTRSRTLFLPAPAPAVILGVVISVVGVLRLAGLTDVVEVYDEVYDEVLLLAGTVLLGLLLDSKNLTKKTKAIVRFWSVQLAERLVKLRSITDKWQTLNPPKSFFCVQPSKETQS